MSGFDKQAAIRCFEENPLGKEGDIAARYWLSLWHGDELPKRANFQPKPVVQVLQSIALFDVTPGKSVRCRLLGTELVRGLKQDITGHDLKDITDPAIWPTRLERWSKVAEGSIGRGLRAGYRESGDLQYSEELMLPFADVGDDGVRPVLFHIAWRQSVADPTRTGVTNVTGLSTEFRLTSLRK